MKHFFAHQLKWPKFGHAAQVIGHRLAVDGQKIIKIKIFRKKYVISGKTNFGPIMMFSGRYRPHHLQKIVKNTVFEANFSQKLPKFGNAAQVIGHRLAVDGPKIIKIKIFSKKICNLWKNKFWTYYDVHRLVLTASPPKNSKKHCIWG